MFLTDQKLTQRIAELKEYRYRETKEIPFFYCSEDESGVVNPPLPTETQDWSKIPCGSSWSGRDRYLWLDCQISLPAAWKGKDPLGIFDFGTTGGGNTCGFEAMAYVNGEMYQAVDANHMELFFDDALCGTDVRLTFRLWSGHERGGLPQVQEHRIARASYAYLDGAVDDFYYLASMMLETIAVLEDSDSTKYDLRRALDTACLCIDWSYPGSDSFYESVHEADQLLNDAVSRMDKHSAVTVFCVGHTHIDVAWLWRLKHTKEKASRSFATVLRLMERYPEYLFLQTQPQLYEYIKEDFPELYRQIRQRVAEGRWEADGAMWVEADCNLTSGESLTRQILLGSKFIKDEFGKDVHYLWLPDVFGYSWALPQILKKAGIDVFMTTKISWNQYNRMPHDTFIWKGIDGSEVLTHFITTPDPASRRGSWFYTYNGLMNPQTVKGSWEAYSEKQLNRDLLIAYGYGDGGGGVNRDMLENRRRISKLPGLPNLVPSTAADYFEKLKENIKNTDQFVHTWDGELYLEYHRGTYTSQAYNKRMNRKMELLYRDTEWLTAAAAIARGSLSLARQEDLTKGWKHLLTNQFHDIIPGSSCHEVYEDCKKDYAYIASVAEEVQNGALDTLISEKENFFTVINASAWTRDEIVSFTNETKGRYTDSDGNKLISQRQGTTDTVLVKAVPAMGVETILFISDNSIPGQNAADPVPGTFGNLVPDTSDNTVAPDDTCPFSRDGCHIETPHYSISLNEHGQITRLYDKDYDREVLPEGARANVLQVFEDKPLKYDAWDIDIFYQQKMREITDLTKMEMIACGPLYLKLHLEWKYMNSSLEQDMILYSASRRIDFQTRVDYHERHQLLKAAFPVDVRATCATYDVQYGNVKRPNHWNTSWDQAKFESVAHRWADLSERNYGVSLLNDCKYGHDIKDNVMRITLLKAATHPDHSQDQGLHEFTYSLLPHGGDFVAAQTVPEAFALNDPMRVIPGVLAHDGTSFLSFDCDEVELDAVKKSEDGKYLVIRFHDFAGSAHKLTLRTGFAFKTWTEGNLREEPIGKPSAEPEIRLAMHAYEIKTILIELFP